MEEHSQEEAQRGRRSEGNRWRRSEREKVRREKMQVCEKAGKLGITLVFQCFVAPEGRKVGSIKRRVRSRIRNENGTPLWREASFVEGKSVKAHGLGPLLEVEMLKSVRRCGAKTCGSQTVQNAPFSEHFWKLRCRESSRRCGVKHIWK